MKTCLSRNRLENQCFALDSNSREFIVTKLSFQWPTIAVHNLFKPFIFQAEKLPDRWRPLLAWRSFLARRRPFHVRHRWLVADSFGISSDFLWLGADYFGSATILRTRRPHFLAQRRLFQVSRLLFPA